MIDKERTVEGLIEFLEGIRERHGNLDLENPSGIGFYPHDQLGIVKDLDGEVVALSIHPEVLEKW